MEEFTEEVAAALGRTLVHTAADAALGTLGETGGPHVSHVACATAVDGAPLLLLSDLALHAKNLKRDTRASLLYVAPPQAGADTNTRARVTLDGKLTPVTEAAPAKSRFLRRQPAASLYAGFGDFQFYRLDVKAAHLVAGFGRITALPPAQLIADKAAAEVMAQMDEGACTHMNEDHLDALEAMAMGISGAQAGRWSAIGVDPWGIDLLKADECVRAEYGNVIGHPSGLRKALKDLTDRARAALVTDEVID
ncbi:MAG: pyridoxamine 5'-phosphate oxidase family protein [Pseudomonadota bacterium]